MTAPPAHAPPSGTAPATAPLLEARGVRKSFLGVEVLHGVDLDLRPGEVHALVGENGAGKSTLMKIIAGVHQPDGGTLHLDGQPIGFPHPLAAYQAGVSTVFQEFNLLPERTVAENVYLGREPRRRGLIDEARMVADTATLLDDLGVTTLSPRDRVRTLSVAQQQVVELAKALSYEARIVSMDEPTAALADHEVALLYDLVRTLRRRGVAILYVSHRLREIFDLADRVTVLKDGHRVDTVDTVDLTPDALVRKMVGRSFTAFFPDKLPSTTTGDVRLRIRGGGNDQLDDIDLDVHAGEIVGLAGLQGSGRTEVGHALFGIDRFTRGTVELDGEVVTIRSPRQAVRHGLALVSEDRKREGLSLNRTILDNARAVVDAVRPRTAPAATRQLPDLLRSLELISRGLDQEVQFLSGGNQQKVVLAKWLVTAPRVIVLDEPTRGVDVGAKRAVHELIRRLADGGVAVVLISSELPEVLGMADRVVVLHDGSIAGELDPAAGEEAVMSLATGHDPSPQEIAELADADLFAEGTDGDDADGGGS